MASDPVPAIELMSVAIDEPSSATHPGDQRPGTGRWSAPVFLDLGLGAGLLMVAVLSGLYLDSGRPGTVAPATWWQWVLIVTPAILATVRRWAPVVAVVAATVAQALIWISNLPEFLLALVVVMFTAASEGGTNGFRAAVGGAGVLTLLTAIGLRLADDVSVYQVPLVALTCGAAIALGVAAAHQRERAAELAARITADRLAEEHRRRQAVIEERTAIARELHDSIGHSLATIAVRAEAADRIGEKRPEVAAEAIASIAVVARQSLDETRRALAGLRQVGGAELEPPPDLAALENLIARTRESGVSIDYRQSGCDTVDPSAMVAGGAFRIVQESLSNAIRHGRADSVITVQVTGQASGLYIEVANSLREPSETRAGDGHGMRGMAERAQVLGGSFEAGATQERFVVRAFLPFGPVS